MPTAALITAGAGLVGSIGSSLIGSSASQKAASQQAAAQQAALQTQQSMFNQGLTQQQNMFGTAQNIAQPFISAGQGALGTLGSLLTPGPSQTSTLQNLPGFQFQSQWGTMSAENALSAMGLGKAGGPLGQAVSNYNQGLAGTSFQNLVAALQGYAGMGANAANALSGAAAGVGNTALNAATAALSPIGATTSGIGTAQAAGTLGSANALSSGLTGGSSAVANAALLSALGSQLKTNNYTTQNLYSGQIPQTNAQWGQFQNLIT